jgi:putative ABC transport system permease protein
VVGLAAGSYPAFYLASFNPVEILKSRVRTKFRSYGIRNILVIFQFFISIGLIISTLTVYKQLKHLQRVNIGFRKDNIINLLHTRNLGQQALPFKQALLQDKSVVSASYANRLPPNIDWQAVFRPVDSSEEFLLTVYEMDHDHLETMGYTMSKGRFFDRSIPSDSNAIILNETAARKLGMEDFEGQKIISHYDRQTGKVRTIIGIIHDFNFQSLKHPIQPMAVILGDQPNWEMAIRLADVTTEEKIKDIETLWKKYAPGAPFEYTVLDRNFTDTMQIEKKMGRIFLLFTSLAIFIASLGLYGLANYTAVYRSKEIGIRKVMGATTGQLIILLSKDFTKLVLIAFLIAVPVCLYLLNEWLHQFAYHVHIDAGIILIAGTSALLIALITISYQAFKTALSNPVDSLRDE